MKSQRMIAGLVFLVVSADAAPAQVRETEEAAVLSADAAWENVYAAKNLDKAVAFCDDKASLLWPNMPIVTRKAAVRNAIAKDFATGSLSWHSNNAGAAGDLAYTSGTYQAKYKDASGKWLPDKGKYLTVWKKQSDGSWKVLFDTFNTDLPPS